MRVAIAGTGWGARGYISVLRALPGVEIVGLWGRSRERVDQIANEHGIDGNHRDFGDLLKQTEPHLVGVAVPPTAVAAFAAQAIESGAHVLAERCRHASEALSLLRLAEKYGLSATPDLEYRFMDPNVVAGELIEQGALGQVLHISHREAAWWRADPHGPHSWWHSIDEGGGALAAMGTHVIDLISSWVGEFEWVEGASHIFNQERTAPHGGRTIVTADDFTVVTAKSATGVMVNVVLTAVSPVALPSTTLIEGTEGWLQVTMPDIVEVCNQGHHRRRVPIEPADPLRPPFQNHWQVGLWRLMKEITSEATVQSPVTLMDLAASLRVVELIRESHIRGTRVAVDRR